MMREFDEHRSHRLSEDDSGYHFFDRSKEPSVVRPER